MTQLASAIPNAKQYEEWNNATGRRWLDKHEAVDRQIAPFGLRAMGHADIRPGERVLDIGCGCGETSFDLAHRVGPSGFVTGIDISRLLIDTARQLAERSNLSNVRFEAADAQTFPLPLQSFDLFFSRFGIMFFDDPEAAFGNFREALRPGGRLSFVCWSAPQENQFMTIPIAAASRHITLPQPGNPEDPGPFAFADPRRIRRILLHAGFSEIQTDRVIEKVGGETLDETARMLLELGLTASSTRSARRRGARSSRISAAHWRASNLRGACSSTPWLGLSRRAPRRGASMSYSTGEQRWRELIRPCGSGLDRLRVRVGALAVVSLLLTGSSLPAVAATSNWVTDQHGAARLISAVEATGSSTQVDVGLQLRLTPGWHTYWRSPGDAGIPPSIDWKGSENFAGAEIAWPAPTRLPSLGGLETVGYEDGVVLPIAVRLTQPGAPLHLHAEVDYASCKDICIPYHASLDLALPAGLARPGAEAPLLAEAHARVPADLSAAQLDLLGAAVESRSGTAVLSVRLASVGDPFSSPDLFIEGLQKGAPRRPETALSDAGKTVTLRVPIAGAPAAVIAGKKLKATVVDGARAAEMEITPVLGGLPPLAADAGRIAVLGLALLGGLILNLMPCVLPVLSLKLLALAGYAGAERRAARLGLLATAAGVMVSFGVLAAALILLKAAGAAIGWGIQFQQPWFLAGMALVTALFAASLWGWAPIILPAGIADAIGSVRGHGRFTNAFLTGAFATLLAASCSAPFVGTAVGFALARGPTDITLVFGALGLGMAGPFVAVAAFPGFIAHLPRPGRWMIWLERVLGLALLGTAVWLLLVLALEVGTEPALVAGGLLALLLVVLAWRQRRSPDGFVRRSLSAVAIGLATVAVVVPSLRGEAISPATHSQAISGQWQAFDEASLHRMAATGKIVFVDVTAAWCLTCKANELAVLDRPPVADRLRDPHVVAMRADWTRADPLITAYLQSFGRYGVPLDVVYGPGAPQGIPLPELLTSRAVMDAFAHAASGGKEEARE